MKESPFKRSSHLPLAENGILTTCSYSEQFRTMINRSRGFCSFIPQRWGKHRISLFIHPVSLAVELRELLIIGTMIKVLGQKRGMSMTDGNQLLVQGAKPLPCSVLGVAPPQWTRSNRTIPIFWKRVVFTKLLTIAQQRTSTDRHKCDSRRLGTPPH